MQPFYRKSRNVKVNAFALISLLMKEFLGRESLDLECLLQKSVKRSCPVKIVGSKKVSRTFFDFVENDFRSTLERRLSETEKHFLEIKVSEFIDRRDDGLFQAKASNN